MKKHFKADPKLKKFVSDCTDRYTKILGVSNYRIDFRYHKEERKGDEPNVAAADIMVNRRYLRATINVYPYVAELWKSKHTLEVEEIICHEVCHLVTEHFKDVALASYRDEGEFKDAWETCTEMVAHLAGRIKALTK